MRYVPNCGSENKHAFHVFFFEVNGLYCSWYGTPESVFVVLGRRIVVTHFLTGGTVGNKRFVHIVR